MANYNKGLRCYRKWKTRKDWRKFGEERTKYYSFYVGKSEKKGYNRCIRNSAKLHYSRRRKYPLHMKCSQWKKTPCADLYNWC